MALESSFAQYCSDIREYFKEAEYADNVVYTVMIGESDSLKQPQSLDPKYQYYCITDAQAIEFGHWTPIIVPKKYRDNRRTARVFKILPGLVFGQSTTSIFVDASIVITGKVSDFVSTYCGDASISCLRHAERNCIYQEAQACIRLGKDDPTTIQTQMNHYREEEYPAHRGLISSGVLVRQHQEREVRRLMQCWHEEIDQHSVRDQLSFNYASWKTDVGYNEIALDIFNNAFFEVQPHTSFQRFNASGQDEATLYEKARHHIYSLRTKLVHRLKRLNRQ